MLNHNIIKNSMNEFIDERENAFRMRASTILFHKALFTILVCMNHLEWMAYQRYVDSDWNL